jgi:hypothetical protein
MTDRDRDFADATRVVDESAVMRTIAGITRVFVERPFPPSPRLRRTAEAERRRKGPLYVLFVVVACATHAVLLQWMPDRIAPVKPLAYGMVVAFGVFATVAGFITTRSSATATADSSAGTANTRKS